jgi:hypothetical protein
MLGSGTGRCGVIGEPLDDLVFGALVAGKPTVTIPARLIFDAGVKYHRRGWIPGLNDNPESCGEHRRLPNLYAEEWCLRPLEHEGECFPSP